MSNSKGKLSSAKLLLLDKLLDEEGLLENDTKIKPRESVEFAPLSFAQERFWFVQQLEPNLPIFNMPASVRLYGDLNINWLENSINHIIENHESLRTVFRSVNGEIIQNVLGNQYLKLKVVDLRKLSSVEQRTKLKNYEEVISCKMFDLEKGPLIQLQLICLEDNEHVLLICLHHMVFDGWSLGIFLKDLTQAYEFYVNGGMAKKKIRSYTRNTIQYGDYANWQRNLLKGEKLHSLIAYWKNHLIEAPSSIEIPNSKKRKYVQTFEGKTSHFQLSKELLSKLKDLSKKEDVTLYMLLLSVLKLLLYRYTEQKKIVIGTPIANRKKYELEPIIGLLMNTLVLYTDFTDETNFFELLSKVKKVTLEAYEHQDIPFEKLVENLESVRDLSRHPLFQIMFVLQNSPTPLNELSNLNMSVRELDPGISKFDLTVRATELEDHLSVAWEYNVDIFEESMMNKMMNHFQVLLEEVVNHPEYKLSEFSLLTKEEKGQLQQWNQTERSIPEEMCIHQLFEKQVAKNADKLAVLSGRANLTYGELNKRSNQVAHFLQEQGVGPETRVGICMNRSLELVICMMGILKAGAAYVPIDPSVPKERKSYIVESSEAAIVLTQEDLKQQLPEKRVNWDYIYYDRDEFQHYQSKNVSSSVQQKNTAYLIYTSGSTGRPKGVIEAHRPVINVIDWVNKTYEVGENDRMLWITSIGFDLSVYDVFGLLAAGGSIRIASEQDIGNPERLISLLNEGEVTFWDSAPAALQQLVPLLKMKENAVANSHLRLVFLSGDWIPLELPGTMKELFPRVQVVGLGGATEATIWSNYYNINDIPEEWTSIPYGKPIQNARYYILDQHGNPCPIGIPGELHIGGRCLAEGYVSRELTEERFISDPFVHQIEAKMYRTGDLARYQEDGNIEFLGRLDHQVKVRGYRVELGEIESVLNQHKNIQESVV
ncbi:non-ribosomal peptide synthetase, partial [Shouchella patagoniensis]|uniref:non-ribosomal peptide synthetase n=1 Tax=Shouchella patagoniensis TaxID=228576 RepID=UPI001C59918D